MSIYFYGLFVAYLVATLANGDEIQVEVDANANAKQSLDELSKEVNEMKSQLTKNDNDEQQQPPNDTVSDGGDNKNGNGNSQRAALGEINTIKKIIDILETVVVPAVVDRQNAQEQYQKKAGADPSAASSDPIKILPKGFKLLQHHAITSNVDDGSPTATNQNT